MFSFVPLLSTQALLRAASAVFAPNYCLIKQPIMKDEKVFAASTCGVVTRPLISHWTFTPSLMLASMLSDWHSLCSLLAPF